MRAPTPIDHLHHLAAEAAIAVTEVAGGDLPGRLTLDRGPTGRPRRTILLNADLDAGRRAAVFAFCIAAFADERVQWRLSRTGGLGVAVRTRPAQRRVAALAQHMVRTLGLDTPVTFGLVDLPASRASATAGGGA